MLLERTSLLGWLLLAFIAVNIATSGFYYGKYRAIYGFYRDMATNTKLSMMKAIFDKHKLFEFSKAFGQKFRYLLHVFKTPNILDTLIKTSVASNSNISFPAKKETDQCPSKLTSSKKRNLDDELDNAPASYFGHVLKFTKSGTLLYMCSRNNNFSNR